MASLFKTLSDDMEKVAQVVTEGTKFMMGETPDMGGGQEGDTATASEMFEGDEDGEGIFDDIEGMEDAYGSPLMGMADSVMSDIMSHQVSCTL